MSDSSAAAGSKKGKRGNRHAFVVHSHKFIVDRTYVPVKPIGKGAYGVVCSAINKTTETKVAIKKIFGAFDDLEDTKRIIREIKLLRHFHHPNIVALLDIVNPLTHKEFEDLYLVFDLMEMDLQHVLSSFRKDMGNDHFRYLTYQLMCGLKYIHSAHVIHRDMKPSNLLINNADCTLKICDFGLARGVQDDGKEELTEYVVTRWYRAPELLFACHHYDFKVDVWAAGCILYELLSGKVLFKGENPLDQIDKIFSVLGTPSKEETAWINNENSRRYLASLERKPKTGFSDLLPAGVDPLAKDLLEKMVVLNPEERFSVEQCLDHPYFSECRDPTAEQTCPEKFDYSWECSAMSKEEMQREIFGEICKFRECAQSEFDPFGGETSAPPTP